MRSASSWWRRSTYWQALDEGVLDPTPEISFVGSVDAARGRDVALTDAVRVQGEESDVLEIAVLSGQAASILGADAERAADLVCVAAVEEIEQRLRAGTLPPDDGSTTVEILYGSTHVPMLQAARPPTGTWHGSPPSPPFWTSLQHVRQALQTEPIIPE